MPYRLRLPLKMTPVLIRASRFPRSAWPSRPALSKDIRVILIKICDRLHNTRTMEYQTPAKQISKSRETMDIYAPLAHRLGMQKIKWELEDTSLKYLDPAGYNEIMQYLADHQREADSFMRAIQS